jgi:hypothetical protein
VTALELDEELEREWSGCVVEAALSLVVPEVAEFVEVPVWLTEVPVEAWARLASWTASAATPPTPTTTMPAVTCVSRRAPRARTLLGRCPAVMT